jgi:hypothetical protein
MMAQKYDVPSLAQGYLARSATSYRLKKDNFFIGLNYRALPYRRRKHPVKAGLPTETA